MSTGWETALKVWAGHGYCLEIGCGIRIKQRSGQQRKQPNNCCRKQEKANRKSQVRHFHDSIPTTSPTTDLHLWLYFPGLASLNADIGQSHLGQIFASYWP